MDHEVKRMLERLDAKVDQALALLAAGGAGREWFSTREFVLALVRQARRRDGPRVVQPRRPHRGEEARARLQAHSPRTA